MSLQKKKIPLVGGNKIQNEDEHTSKDNSSNRFSSSAASNQTTPGSSERHFTANRKNQNGVIAAVDSFDSPESLASVASTNPNLLRTMQFDHSSGHNNQNS